MFRGLQLIPRFASSTRIRLFSQKSVLLDAAKVNYYRIFHNTFPYGPPPAGSFDVDQRQLRKEFRKLQAKYHPDILNSGDDKVHLDDEEYSSLLNNAYATLKSPLTRAQYILKLNANIDITTDEASKSYQFKDKALLLDILEIHEELENVSDDSELAALKISNDERIAESISKLGQLFKDEDYENAAMESIKLKYWFNIDNAIKEWEEGKPVIMTH
ncbi:Fe-S cluster biogenesis specialized J-protein [Komagataella phaffii CBS 7435]|uniref:Specialized J-protein that functions with Hsp70 in Fe-S cluster biogenesis in mitochondria n=2 Tax=Komagataella phaffii TaxID=460519 RepID=C4R7M2_KOMPG|nr:Specialized J-protein that functions with Hsp70 in Fe-S cluster biogenesis in mitochondria [Komagataella phaffii GS115]AOA65162.1 GQ67_04693T0 [Komagataella phaffii]CAH2451026.1 Fe-S cluster biogenesis specialized J-protein [Komagataella phaffii CBS 7435]AOA70412.1 GQ68_04665T0 [Komagataella phaffii GS115]CAY71597.1 Specialized J-protein that functions with Hsp70 in Fe-S cluster biogenesis in mitochondria [Komagataella phaffii GS115]CCA40799.1 Fe-S cluster biogenesis specialized J-protein [